LPRGPGCVPYFFLWHWPTVLHRTSPHVHHLVGQLEMVLW
jgi:hypothetical protein